MLEINGRNNRLEVENREAQSQIKRLNTKIR
jgi:hypothetical protein